MVTHGREARGQRSYRSASSVLEPEKASCPDRFKDILPNTISVLEPEKASCPDMYRALVKRLGSVLEPEKASCPD